MLRSISAAVLGRKPEKKTPAARTLILNCGREPAPEKI
jgi:hypothetical protein